MSEFVVKIRNALLETKKVRRNRNKLKIYFPGNESPPEQNQIITWEAINKKICETKSDSTVSIAYG